MEIFYTLLCGVERWKRLRATEEECETIWIALCTRMTAQIMMRSVTGFIPFAWETHAFLVRPIVVRKKCAPASRSQKRMNMRNRQRTPAKAIKNKQATIPLQIATLDHQTQWHNALIHFIDLPRTLFEIGGHVQMQTNTTPSHRPESGHRCQDVLCVKKWKFLCKCHLDQKIVCVEQARANHNGTAAATMEATIPFCNPGSPNKIAHRSHASH